MAIGIENENSTTLNDGGSYTIVGTGSNRFLLQMLFGSDQSASSTITVNTLDSTNFDVYGTERTDGDSVPWFYGEWSGFKDGHSLSGAVTHNTTLDNGWANTAAFIAELSGVDQTTPVVADQLLKDESVSSLTFAAVNIDTDDVVYLMVSADTARTFTTPSALGGVDSWSLIISDQADLVGGSMDGGSVFRAVATEDHPNEVIAPSLDSAANNMSAMLVVVRAAAAATAPSYLTLLGVG